MMNDKATSDFYEDPVNREFDRPANKKNSRPPKPDPVECVICGEKYDWEWDDYHPDYEGWYLESEEWKALDGREGLICSRRCWIETKVIVEPEYPDWWYEMYE